MRRGRSRNLGNRNPNLTLRFLPGGAGVSHVSDNLYTPFASEFTGNWFYLHGDGTQPAGSVALTAQGSPTSERVPVVPNGPNGATRGSVRLNGTSQSYKTADTASPTGDFSVGILFKLDRPAATQMVSKDSNELGNRAALLDSSLGTDLRFYVFKGDSTFSGIDVTSALTPGAWHFAVATYDFIADGTSVMRLYLDGTERGTAVTTAVGPAQAAASTYWAVGEREYSSNRDWLQGNVALAFMTEKVLSAATIEDMNRYVRGTVSGSMGETLTFTRASAASVELEDGTVAWVPSGVPRITRGGILVEGARTNLLLRSQEFDNATWQKNSSTVAPPVVTANAHLAPDGTTTADEIAFPAITNATYYSQVFQTVTAAAAVHSWGLWLKKISGTATTIPIRFHAQDGTPIGGVVHCALTSQWTRFKSENFTLPAEAVHVILGPDGTHTGLQDGVVVAAWGAQLEAAPFMSSYIRTEGSTVTRPADNVSISVGADVVNEASGCAVADFRANGFATGSSPRVIGFQGTSNADTPIAFDLATRVAGFDASTGAFASVTVSSVVDRNVRARGEWSGSTLAIEADGLRGTVGTFDGFGSVSSVFIGNQNAGAECAFAVIKDVAIGKDPDAVTGVMP